MTQSPSVAVIGAGYAGMAAASELAARSVPVTVFEAAQVLGGRARVVTHRGMQFDNGQHILVGAYRETLRLMRLVGSDCERALLRLPFGLTYPGKAAIAAPAAILRLTSMLGRVVPVASGIAIASALVFARGLSLGDKRAATRFLQALCAAQYRLDADSTVGDLLRAHRQPARVCEFLWQPLCFAALNTPPDAASAQVFVNVLRDTLADNGNASELLLPRVDLSALFPDPAERYITTRGGRVLRRTAVRRIEAKDSQFVLHTGSVDRHGSRHQSHGPYSHVIVATAPRQQQALIADLPELAALARTTASIGFEPIVTCYLAYPPATRLSQPMLGLTGGFAQWLFDRGQIGGPPGVIAAVISARGRHSELDRERLAAEVHKEIAAIVPDLARPSWTQVIHEARATFACVPAMARPQAQTALPGLLLAGDYVASDYPATIEAAVRSGVKAASCI